MNGEAEKQELIIRLPVKIGDTIYKIPSDTNYRLNRINQHPELNRVYCQEVTGIKIGKHGVFIETFDGMSGVRLETLGMYWFLKKEEAEQELKEIEEKYEVEKNNV